MHTYLHPPFVPRERTPNPSPLLAIPHNPTQKKKLTRNNPTTGLRPILQLLQRPVRRPTTREPAILRPPAASRRASLQRRFQCRDLRAGLASLDRDICCVDREWHRGVQYLGWVSAAGYHEHATYRSDDERGLLVSGCDGPEGDL